MRAFTVYLYTFTDEHGVRYSTTGRTKVEAIRTWRENGVTPPAGKMISRQA